MKVSLSAGVDLQLQSTQPAASAVATTRVAKLYIHANSHVKPVYLSKNFPANATKSPRGM